MGRLLAGLSQVGAWGCFGKLEKCIHRVSSIKVLTALTNFGAPFSDEFNRLEEKILSAVSQQILTIQRGLIEQKSEVELLGRSIRLHENVGIFITMNPGYEGRSNLPDNLKNLFRSFAMVVPDRKLIAQVMLYSQGIVTAEGLAPKVVDLFLKCKSRMSDQLHYVSLFVASSHCICFSTLAHFLIFSGFRFASPENFACHRWKSKTSSFRRKRGHPRRRARRSRNKSSGCRCL